jgi:hypothetical protein
LAIKTLAVNVTFEHSEANVATKEMAMEDQTPNINVIRSVWRRIKKGKIRDLEIRELEPAKDVKGGRGGVTDQSNRITGGPGTTGKQ